MELERYYWVREKNERGQAVGDWQPAWLDKQSGWWTRQIPGWISDEDCQRMFEVYPVPLELPKV